MLNSDMAYIIRKNGDKAYCLVSSLKNSNHILSVKCEDCGRIFETLFSNRKRRLIQGKIDLCRACAHKGKRNSQYGKDRSHIISYARSFVKNFSRDFSEDTKVQMSKTRTRKISDGEILNRQGNMGKKSIYFSAKNGAEAYADSLLEVFRMIQLDNDDTILTWTKRHSIVIPYTKDGRIRHTTPDFLITHKDGTTILEEVKGRITECELIKKSALEEYCKENGYKFSFVSQKFLNKNGEYRKFLKAQKIS